MKIIEFNSPKVSCITSLIVKTHFPSAHTLFGHYRISTERNICIRPFTKSHEKKYSSALPAHLWNYYHPSFWVKFYIGGHPPQCAHTFRKTIPPLFCNTPHQSLWTQCFPGCVVTVGRMNANVKCDPKRRAVVHLKMSEALERHLYFHDREKILREKILELLWQ